MIYNEQNSDMKKVIMIDQVEEFKKNAIIIKNEIENQENSIIKRISERRVRGYSAPKIKQQHIKNTFLKNIEDNSIKIKNEVLKTEGDEINEKEELMKSINDKFEKEIKTLEAFIKKDKNNGVIERMIDQVKKDHRNSLKNLIA